MFSGTARLSLFFAVLSLLSASGLAQAHPGTPDRAAQLRTAWTRARHLRHGINASQWFVQTPPYLPEHLETYIDAQDIALMKQMGFDHVRISIDPAELEPALANGANAWYLADLDRAVDVGLKNDLAVLIDIHPPDSYKYPLRSNDAAVARLTELWQKLAAHYAKRNPDLVFFEILNEPTVNDPVRWQGIQAQVASAIRAVAPRNTIIATGANWADVPDLMSLKPLADGNVIYNFHFYEPHAFTHQGAKWGKQWWSYTHSIVYPPNPEDMAQDVQEVPEGADRYELEDYWLDHWDWQHIRSVIDEAAEWGQRFQVPVICDEFGAFGEHTDATSRANWIRDVRTALEADGLGWTMWEYRGGFGVVTKRDGQAALPDPVILQALGLSGK